MPLSFSLSKISQTLPLLQSTISSFSLPLINRKILHLLIYISTGHFLHFKKKNWIDSPITIKIPVHDVSEGLYNISNGSVNLKQVLSFFWFIVWFKQLLELKFLVIAKSLMDGITKGQFFYYKLKVVEPPSILQELVNHGGVIFKVYKNIFF